MSTSETAAAVLVTEMEVRISAPADAVWKGLTEDIGAWWPQEFYAGGEPATRGCHLEPTPGGRMYESWDGGGGLVWATVVSVEPSRRLQVFGTLFPGWGGPAVWFGTWDIEARGAKTILKFSESTVGHVSEALAAEKDKGWRFLFGAALKSYLEGEPSPAWETA